MHVTTLIKAAALVITFALVAVPAWAQVDNPEAGADGVCLGLDPITSTALDPLASVQVIIPNTGPPWHCNVNCYIQADNPFAGVSAHGQLLITNNGAVVPLTQRNFELTDDAIAVSEHENYLEVSSGVFIPNLPAGGRIFACAAHKLSAVQPNFNVARSCIKVACFDHRL